MISTELINPGFHAYQSGDFDAAINYFSSLDNKSPGYWSGRMYLAMSFWHIGKLTQSIQTFKDVSEWCPDEGLRQKAIMAMRELNAQRAQFQPGKK